MKKIFFVFLLALGCISCSQEIQEESVNRKGMTIRADLTSVKVSIDQAGKVCWEDGDEIGVFIDGKIVKFTLDSGAGTASGSFVSDIYTGNFDGIAVYPYDESLSLADNKVSVKLASESTRGRNLLHL